MTSDSIIESSAFATLTQTAAGDRLKAARKARGLTINQVAAETRLTRDMLAALEAMQTEHVSPTILRMQATAYANYLGLPAGDIANAYAPQKAKTDVEDLPVSRTEPSEPAARRFMAPAAAAAAALVIAGVFGLMSLNSGPISDADLPVYRQVTTADTSSIDRILAGPKAREELAIRAVSSAWIEVRGSDGTIFRNRMMDPGEVYYPRLSANWSVTVKDAGAFEWWLDDQRAGPLGEPGQAIYSASIDEALVSSREAVATALADAEANRSPAR